MDLVISGAIKPLNASRMVNSTLPFFAGDNVKVRVPLNKPSGMPPDQTHQR
jgi:hypothetical protein